MKLTSYLGILLFFIAVPARAEAPAGMLPNPGFTEGMDLDQFYFTRVTMAGTEVDKGNKSPDGKVTQYPDHVAVIIDDKEAHDPGGKSLKVTRLKSNPEYFPYTITVKLIAQGLKKYDFLVVGGKFYEVSFWAKTDNPHLKMTFFLESSPVPGPVTQLSLPHLAQRIRLILSAEWRKYSMLVNLPVDRRCHFWFECFRYGDSVKEESEETIRAVGSIWIDDLSCQLFEY